MKFFDVICLSAVLAVSSSVGYAQTQADSLPEITQYGLTDEGDSLRVEFAAKLPAGFLRSREAYILTPVLTTQTGETALPALSVEGRHYYFAAERDEAAQHVRYTRDTMTAVYNRTIPATAELRHAGLRVDAAYRTLCPCDKGRAAGPEVLSGNNAASDGKGADLSAFAGRTQILYYIPADYIEPGTYAHDFGGKSVFPNNGTTVDKTVFDPAMQEVIAGYERIKGDPALTVNSIQVAVASSPDGQYAYNKYLADTRAESIRKHLAEGFRDADLSIVEVTAEAENWDAFTKALPASDIRDKAAVERILAQYSDPDEREAALRKLPEWPAVYRIFNASRNCRIVIAYGIRKNPFEGRETTSEGVIESRLNAPAGCLTVEEATRIASIDGSPVHQNNRMVACIESGDYDTALQCAGQIPDEGISPFIAGNKAVLYSLTGDSQQAERYFRMAAGTPAVDYNRGVAALNAGNEAEAAELLAPYTDK